MRFLVGWFAQNRVAANMIMLAIVVIGCLAVSQTRKEILPPLQADSVTVLVQWPDASPEQSESQLCIPLEQALSPLDKITDIQSFARQGGCFIRTLLAYDSDVDALIKQMEQALRHVPLPQQALKPEIKQADFNVMIARIGVVGSVDYQDLYHTAEQVRHDLIARGLDNTVIRDAPDYQLSIELSEQKLQQYQLSFAEVAKVLLENAKQLGAGSIDSDGSQALIKLNSHYNRQAIEKMVIRAFPDGSKLTLADVALVYSGLADKRVESQVDGEPAISVSVYQDRHYSITDVSAIVNQYLHDSHMPQGVRLVMLQDNSSFFFDRMKMLQSNAWSGFALVFLVLFIFLRLRLAFWVIAGIPMAFMGGFIALYLTGNSINMVSTFGLLIVLGVVTDDAVVVAENVHRHQGMGKSGLQAAIDGTQEMLVPVSLAVLTTAITFVPLAFLPGEEGRIAGQIPLIVVAVLLFSLLECFFVLPAHLSHARASHYRQMMGFAWIEAKKQALFAFYHRLLKKALYWRYATCVFFSALFVIGLSLIESGQVPINFQLSAESEVAVAYVAFPAGSNHQQVRQAVHGIEQASLALKKRLLQRYGVAQILSVRTFIAPDADNGSVYINLATGDQRKLSGEQLMRLLKEQVGPIAAASVLSFSNIIGEQNQNQLNITLSAENAEALSKASAALRQTLSRYQGVYHVQDSLEQSSEEVSVQLKPEARQLGLSFELLSSQVRAAFAGMELVPFEQDNRLFRVQLQLFDQNSRSLWQLQNLPIRLPDGSLAPLNTLATIQIENSPSLISRMNGKRVANISLQFDPQRISKEQLSQHIQRDFLDTLSQSFPAVYSGKLSGDSQKALLKQRLLMGFLIALIVMYVIMAALFNSYLQPLLILTSIPFGLLGAVLGHLLLGVPLTYLSLAGMVAVSGIVINDEIVMMHYTNQRLKEGANLEQAVQTAGTDRFLAVFITSVTTFFGVLPIIFERSFEAQFLIPMSVSIAFGVLFSALITLVFLPALHLIVDDIDAWLKKLKRATLSAK